MQGGPRHSLAANAMAGWASSDVAATHQRSGTTIINGGKDEPAAGQNSREVKQVHAMPDLLHLYYPSKKLFQLH